ncbi:MAG: glucose-1-phosphate thymidylyltransferase [bacterium]
MKGLILCAGKGTRLRPLTHTNAKQLVPVANKPIIHYGLEAMAEANIREVGIVIGETGPEIREAVGDGSKWKLKITYIEQPEPLGIAHAVRVAEDFLGKEPFVLYLGDNLLRDGIVGLVREFKEQRPNATILLAEVENPTQFGVAEVKKGKIIGLEEKPKKPKSNLAIVGVYLFDSNILSAVRKVKPSWRGELEITDSIAVLLDEGFTINSHVIKGWWKDTGKKEDLLEANRMVLENIEADVRGKVKNSEIAGRVVVEKGATVEDSTIRGPVIIGRGSRVTNAYIGPFTSIDEDVVVEHSEIENSIVLRGSRISNLNRRLEESLIGRDAVVERSLSKPHSYKMMLGDCSRVDVV